jgi:hypothetical protein
MRSAFSCLASVLIMLASVPAGAQTAPLDTVTEVVRQKARLDVKAEYEAARRKHMEWHKAQNDPWEWDVFDVMTGPDTGAYIIASGNHQWRDMEDWNAKHAVADGADSLAAMGFAITSSERSYWTQLNSLSRLPPQNDRLPLATVTYYRIKPGSDRAMRAAIARVNAALDAGNFPLSTIWYVLASGGEGPTFALLTPRAGLGDMAPNPGLLEVLATQLGRARAEALMASFFENVISTSSEMLRRRMDLSYVPN